MKSQKAKGKELWYSQNILVEKMNLFYLFIISLNGENILN